MGREMIRTYVRVKNMRMDMITYREYERAKDRTLEHVSLREVSRR